MTTTGMLAQLEAGGSGKTARLHTTASPKLIKIRSSLAVLYLL